MPVNLVRLMLNSLSGRFLILTTVFVMLAEVMIFVPSVARFREDFLLRGWNARRSPRWRFLAEDMIDEELEASCCTTRAFSTWCCAATRARQLMLSSPIPAPISATYDLRDPARDELISDAIVRLGDPEPRVIRVIGEPVRKAGLLIEVTMETANCVRR